MLRLRLPLVRLAVVAALFAPALGFAQDAAQAEKRRAELQKALANGTDLQKRLRLDKFEAGDKAVKVTGVFLDSPPAKNDDPLPFDQVTEELTKLVREKLNAPNLTLDMKGVTRIPPDQHPHVVVQLAANAAGAKGDASADLAAYTGSVFNENGGLSVVGVKSKTDSPFGWMGRELKTPLDKHPAATRPNGTASVAYNLTPVEWKVSAPELQKVLASAGKAAGSEEEKDRLALRRLLVERAYFTYEVVKGDQKESTATLRFRTDGLRVGEAEVKSAGAQDVISPRVAATAGRPVPGDYGPLVGAVVEEPTKQLRAAVAEKPTLDGVRIDPGTTFGPAGEVLLAGVNPGLTDEARKELQSVVQSNFAAQGKGKPLSAKYERVAKQPVAVKGMAALPINKLMAEMRTWVIRNKDDLKLMRLYFPADADALKRKYFVAADGGLVLLYRPAYAADVKDVETQFALLMGKMIPEGVPQPPGGAAAFAASDEKEPLLPGLTAHLRKLVAGDQKKWNGVLIERGYFDEANRYTLLGVVDSARQNEELAGVLDELKGESKWADYFTPPPNRPALTVIPMSEMIARVQRVTPAYPAFDGIRVESARYDAGANLIFDAHVVGRPDPEAPALQAKLLRDHETYRRRVPAGKQVQFAKIESVPIDDQLANFSLAVGGNLLAKAGDSKEDAARARDWLDVAMLHYPHESAVWFLDAYYQFAVAKDDELTRRDLFRVIGLEGDVAFNGPGQRKRRYEAAKDLQGPTRKKLEDLWLVCFRDVKDGAKPITMTPRK